MKTIDYLILAPHATIPAHDGASMRSNEMALGLIRLGRKVVYVSKEKVCENESDFVRDGVPARERSQKMSVLSAFARRVSYNAGKHITADWLRLAQSAVSAHKPKIVYVHFLWTVPFLHRLGVTGKIVVDTHNYDPEWFRNLLRRTRNPVARCLAKMSLSYSVEALGSLDSSVSLMHVTRRDQRRYQMLNPKCRHFVLPNGSRLAPRKHWPDYGMEKKKLYFIGLLSAKMNEDALEYFAEKIWPVIRQRADFHAIGKAPGPRVRDLCERQGWHLHPDIPEDQLEVLLCEMHFSVMPFEYNAGSKTKLLDSCGRGIPVLSTVEGGRGYSNLPESIFLLETPQEWENALSRIFVFDEAQQRKLLTFAERNSWQSLSRQLDEIALT